MPQKVIKRVTKGLLILAFILGTLIKGVIRVFWILVLMIGLLILHFVYGEYSLTGRLNRAIYDEDIVQLEKVLKECSDRDINSFSHNHIVARYADFSNKAPLHTACWKGEYDMVKLLIEYGANVNFVDPYTGMTALIWAGYATGNEDGRIAKLLIEQRADINAVDHEGNTPLLQAMHFYYSPDDEMDEQTRAKIEVTIYLIEHCDLLEVKDHNHANLLECAASRNNVAIVEYLIENHYFEINDFSENGMTILHFAAKENRASVCRYLLEHGADKNIPDANGKTAYDYALENNHEEILTLLN
ncbi:MAG: ankyrin repeat domain-containing protein [Lachnospiraceae bacterium]|nr:ankyrin repeat domain-containing protein [Lachnospiraceae bacterium]